MAVPIALGRKDGHKAERDRQTPRPVSGEGKGQRFADLPLSASARQNGMQTIGRNFPAAVIFCKFPVLRGRGVRTGRERETGGVPLRPVNTNVAEKGGALPSAFDAQAVRAV